MKRRVVVTGVGAVTSLSQQTEDLWQKVLAGESGVHPLRVFDASEFKVRFGGDIYHWTPEGNTSAKLAKRLDRFTQFALVSGIDAVRDAEIDFSKEDPFRCGVILGSGIGGLNEIETQHSRLLAKGPNKVSAFTIPKLMVNAASGQVSIEFGIQGPNYAVVTACASATNAIGDAFKAIQHDDADVMITGGSEAAITPMGISGFANMKALSLWNDNPRGASRPFDADRGGFVMSEGAGVLVLEELNHARARAASIHGEILGYGASGDGGHITQPNAEGTGAARAMAAALGDAQIDPSTIDHVNAHGTGTQLGDWAETLALKTVFGPHAYKLSISSTKSQLGHLLGASGGVEMILTLLAIRDQVCPPTINYETPDPNCDLDYTPNQPRQREIIYAMSNSFGFGGHNVSLILRRYEGANSG
jgi:3-oxoacyl-[acyl-carrier-protein] synthase II